MALDIAHFMGAVQQKPRPLPFLLQLLRKQLGDDSAAMANALHGLARYQEAERPKVCNLNTVSTRSGRVGLREYPAVGGSGFAPVLFVPSLINGPEILDLSPGHSLLRWLAARGISSSLIDWGTVGPAARDDDLDAHVAKFLVPLIASFDEPVHLVGYCLGGTLAIAAACLTLVRSVTTIAAPWDFGAYPDDRRTEIAQLWARWGGPCADLGLVPVELLQTGFWSLDPDRVAQKFVTLGHDPLDPGKLADFVAVEDWANDGEPLPFAAAAQLFERLYASNESAAGGWMINGQPITPQHVGAPSLSIRSLGDIIVPPETAPSLGNTIDLDAGHVGMMIGKTREIGLWTELESWLRANESGWEAWDRNSKKNR